MINRLFLGDGIYALHSVKLEDLKKAMNNRFPFIYHKVYELESYIKARKSLCGELEVKIEKEEGGVRFKSRVVFSRKEYDTIKKYAYAKFLS